MWELKLQTLSPIGEGLQVNKLDRSLNFIATKEQ